MLLAFCIGTAWAESTRDMRQPESIPAGKTLTLDDCIGLALKNEPSIRQAQAQVEGQTGAVEQSKSNLLPGTSVRTSTNLGDNNGKGTSLTLGASQLIYDFGRSTSALTRSNRQLGANRENLTGAEADVILNVKQSYYTLLQTSHLVDVFFENLKAQEEHAAEAQARKEAGVAPQADVLKAQAAAASARVDLVTAQNNANQAQVNLNSAMGVDITSSTQIAEGSEPEAPVPSQADAVKLALERRPEVLSNALQVQASEAGVKVAKTDNMPAITTSVSQNQNISGSGVSGIGNGTSNSTTWMLNMTWQPYDSGFTRGAVKQAQAQVTSSKETLYTTKQSVSSEVVKARLNLVAAKEQLTSAEAEVASAKENLAAATGRYEAGVGILLEVLDAQSALLKAQTDELSAKYGLSIARASLEHATGGTAVKGR